jgi:hypothetical protein
MEEEEEEEEEVLPVFCLGHWGNRCSVVKQHAI